MRINKALLLLKNQNSIVLIDEAHNHFHHESFSSVLLSAIMSVRVTSVLSALIELVQSLHRLSNSFFTCNYHELNIDYMIH